MVLRGLEVQGWPWVGVDDHTGCMKPPDPQLQKSHLKGCQEKEMRCHRNLAHTVDGGPALVARRDAHMGRTALLPAPSFSDAHHQPVGAATSLRIENSSLRNLEGRMQEAWGPWEHGDGGGGLGAHWLDTGRRPDSFWGADVPRLEACRVWRPLWAWP